MNKQDLLEEIAQLRSQLEEKLEYLKELEKENEVFLTYSQNDIKDMIEHRLCNLRGIDTKLPSDVILMILYNMNAFNGSGNDIDGLIVTLDGGGYSCDDLQSVVQKTCENLQQAELIKQDKALLYKITNKGIKKIDAVISIKYIPDDKILKHLEDYCTIADLTIKLIQDGVEIKEPKQVLQSVKQLLKNQKIECSKQENSEILIYKIVK